MRPSQKHTTSKQKTPGHEPKLPTFFSKVFIPILITIQLNKMTKCAICGKNLNIWAIYRDEDRDIDLCSECYMKPVEKPKKQENENIIKKQIRQLEEGSTSVAILIILGIIGLFFFIIPGIIFFIIASSISSSRKSRAASLRAQLESIKHAKKEKTHPAKNSLDILKIKFAEGQITEEEYKAKKKILQE